MTRRFQLAQSLLPALRMRPWMWVAAAVAVAACGGRVLEQPEPDGSSGASSGHGAAGEGGQVAGSAGSAPSSLPSHGLGACVPGFDRLQNPERTCKFFDEKGKCYETKDHACACICPTDHDSVCFSDFPVDGRPTRVNCL